VAIKFGFKAASVVATAVVSLGLVAGCNTEEAAPSPSAGPAAGAPAKGPETKPPAPPVTPSKTDEAKPKP
jgi:hypothetical protein